MHQQFLSAPRQSGGRNVIAIAADLGVWAGFFFWLWIFVTLLGVRWPTTASDIPPQLIYAILSLLLAGCMAFVTPALWSAVLPSTTAGMLLQEGQRKTLGFAALLAASIYLAYLSQSIIVSWWSAQDKVVAAQLVNQMTIISLIFFVVVPAIAWNWSTPAAWAHQVAQDQQVKQLKLAQQTELALAKAGYSRALMIMSSGLDNATMQQRQYVAGVVMALHRGRNEQLRQVAGHLQALTGVEASLAWKDDQLLGQLEDVRLAIVGNEQPIDEDAARDYEYAREAPRELASPAPARIAPPALTRSRELSRDQAAAGSPPRELTRELSRDLPREQDAEREYTSELTPEQAEAWRAHNLAYIELAGQAWKREQLEKLLNIKQTKALDLIRGWIADGSVVTLDNPKHHYEFARLRGE